MIDVKNKTFFITGLGSGIGMATGSLLASYGAHVTGTVFDKDQADDIASFAEKSFVVDVTDKETLAKAVEQAASHYKGLTASLVQLG